jgi:hypothetical protein
MASFPIRAKWFGWGKPAAIEPPPAPAPPPAPRRAVKKKGT